MATHARVMLSDMHAISAAARRILQTFLSCLVFQPRHHIFIVIIHKLRTVFSDFAAR